MQLRHAIRIRAVATALVAVAEQPLHGVEIALLARCRRFGLPGRARRREPPQSGARLVQVLVQPQRLVVRERLAPVRQGEPGGDFLRFAESGDRVVVLETMEEQDAAYE